jgi:trehalose 6-phosphate phosphatase
VVAVDLLEELLAPLRDAPDRSGVLTDFDGTISEIVDDPDSAGPVPGAAELLAELAGRYHRVAVISGRPVAFLQQQLPAALTLSGLYGLEVVEDGRKLEHPSAGAWREVVDDVASASEARGPGGMRVERKGVSLTLHFRERPDIETDVRAWAERQAARSGLHCRAARMSYELHPPVESDKGTALLALAEGLDAVCFFAGDLGDLRAFDALDQLTAEGVHAVRIAVRSAEAPVPLIERADLVVDGPAGAVEVLRYLAS